MKIIKRFDESFYPGIDGQYITLQLDITLNKHDIIDIKGYELIVVQKRLIEEREFIKEKLEVNTKRFSVYDFICLDDMRNKFIPVKFLEPNTEFKLL